MKPWMVFLVLMGLVLTACDGGKPAADVTPTLEAPPVVTQEAPPAFPAPCEPLVVPLAFDETVFSPLSTAFDGTAIWVGGRGRDVVLKVNPSDGEILQVVQLAKSGVGVPALTFDGESIWALVGDSVVKVRAADGEVADTYYFDFDDAGFTPASILFDGDSIWVGGRDRDLAIKMNPSNGEILQVVQLAKWGEGVPDLAFDGEYVWALVADSMVKVRAADGEFIDTYYFDFDTAGFRPLSLTFDGEALWVGGRDRDLALKVNPSDGEILQVVELAKYGVGVPDLAFDGKYIRALVAGNVIKVRASDGVVVESCWAAEKAFSFVFDGTFAWVADAENGALVRLP